MIDKDLKRSAGLVMAAISMVDPPKGEICKDCDPDVGFLCPQCGLILNAGDLARWILHVKPKKDAELDKLRKVLIEVRGWLRSCDPTKPLPVDEWMSAMTMMNEALGLEYSTCDDPGQVQIYVNGELLGMCEESPVIEFKSD